MHPIQVARIVAGVHVALVAVVVYYVTQIWNYTPLERMPSTDSIVFSATALPPLLAVWIGGRLARGDKGRWFLLIGLILALLVYAFAFLLVLDAAEEPLAPLLLIVASLWVAGGLAVVLLVVWLMGRSERTGLGVQE
jgi:phosphotransferase system  glucose/maltose/N-acetylglucosamine-specific IIC component